MNHNETNFPLTPEEIEQAKPYWNQAKSDFLFIALMAAGLAIFIYVMSLYSVKPLPLSFYFWSILSLSVCVFGFVGFFRITSDEKQKTKQRMEGVFEENGLPANRFTNFLAQRINGIKLIFPPKIYYQLAKGDTVEVHYTRILCIVVSCRKI